MKINLNVKSDYTDVEVKDVISSALEREKNVAKYRREYFRNACAEFEDKYQMTSEIFIEKFEGGELGDDQDFFDWFAVKRGYDKWIKKYNVLVGVSV